MPSPQCARTLYVLEQAGTYSVIAHGVDEYRRLPSAQNFGNETLGTAFLKLTRLSARDHGQVVQVMGNIGETGFQQRKERRGVSARSRSPVDDAYRSDFYGLGSEPPLPGKIARQQLFQGLASFAFQT